MIDHITGNTTFKKIEIIIAPGGETRVETKGFTGSECQDASKFIEDALGRKTNEHLTNEFYQSESARIENRQQS